jgi:hypothetical protein
MNNQPEKNEAAKKNNDGRMLYGLTLAFAVVAGGANIAFLPKVNRMQDADPVFVTPVARQTVEDMGYGNVRIVTFNKAADKPARLTFVAEKDMTVYAGEVECTARHCARFKVEKAAFGSQAS